MSICKHLSVIQTHVLFFRRILLAYKLANIQIKNNELMYIYNEYRTNNVNDRGDDFAFNINIESERNLFNYRNNLDGYKVRCSGNINSNIGN